MTLQVLWAKNSSVCWYKNQESRGRLPKVPVLYINHSITIETAELVLCRSIKETLWLYCKRKKKSGLTPELWFSLQLHSCLALLNTGWMLSNLHILKPEDIVSAIKGKALHNTLQRTVNCHTSWEWTFSLSSKSTQNWDMSWSTVRKGLFPSLHLLTVHDPPS